MSGVFGLRVRTWLGPLSLSLVALLSPRVGTGGEPCCPQGGSAVVTPAARVVVVPRPRGTLGTFVATPSLYVRTGFAAGGAYEPLDFYGNSTMALYGPLSVFRQTAAPVLTYSRGYDGRVVVAPGTSFSSPNLPTMTPVVYPTRANVYYGIRRQSTPPWWQNASNWVDQN